LAGADAVPAAAARYDVSASLQMIHHSSIAGCPKISGQAVIPDTRVDGRGQGREKNQQ
jgi:hypothetical protein